MDKKTKDSKIIVSIPRSGYNFIRYSVEFLTKKRTPGSKTRLITSGDSVFTHTHTPITPKGISKMVLIIRDSKELQLRPNPENDFTNNFTKFYYDLVDVFEKFNGEKILIRYEDLITDINEIKKIITFLDIPLIEDFEEFAKNEEKHRLKSLEISNINHSGGKDTKFYQSQLNSTDEILKFEQGFKNYNPLLYEKYFKTYK